MNVFTRNGDNANWITFDKINYVKDPLKADLIIFPGGNDVDPKYYGEPKGRYTFINTKLDAYDLNLASLAKKNNIPMIGICRGSQLLCVFNNGKLVQHIDNHNGSFHDITTHDGKAFTVNSVHHQMMYPFNLENKEYKLLAYASGHSKRHLNGYDEEIKTGFKCNLWTEPEIVWFPKTRSLCIQSHPEYLSMNDYTITYMNDLVKKYIFCT